MVISLKKNSKNDCVDDFATNTANTGRETVQIPRLSMRWCISIVSILISGCYSCLPLKALLDLLSGGRNPVRIMEGPKASKL